MSLPSSSLFFSCTLKYAVDMGELGTTAEVDSKLCAAINALENLQNTELSDKACFDALYNAIKDIRDVLVSLKTPSVTLKSPINATKAITSISTALVSLRSSLDKTLSGPSPPPCSPLLQLILGLLEFGLFSERWHHLMLSKDPTPQKKQYQAVQASLRALAKDATCPLISAVIQHTAINTNAGCHASVTSYMKTVHGLLNLAETSAALILFKRKTSIKSIRNYATVNVLWLGLLTVLGSIPNEYFIKCDSNETIKLIMQSALNHFQETVSMVFQTRHAPDVKLLLFWLGQWTKLVSISPTVLASLDHYTAAAPIVAVMQEYVRKVASTNINNNSSSDFSEVLEAIEDNAIWSKAAKVIILMLNGVAISSSTIIRPAADEFLTNHQHKSRVDWLADVFSRHTTTVNDEGGGGNNDKKKKGSEHSHQDTYAAAMLLLGAHLLTQPASMTEKVKIWATQTLVLTLLSTITQDAGGLASFITMAPMRTTLIKGIVAMYSHDCGNDTRRTSPSLLAAGVGSISSWLFVASTHNPHPLMTSLFGAVWYELGMSMDERWAEQHVQVLDKMFENAAAVQAHNSTAAGDAEGSSRYEDHVSHLAWLLVCFLIGTTMSYNNAGAKDKSDATDRIQNTTTKGYFIRSYEQFRRQHKDGDDVCTLAATSWRLKMAAMASKLKPSMNDCCSTYSTEVLARMARILPRIPTPKECDYEEDGEVYWYWALDCTASALQHINMCDQDQQRDLLGNKEIVENMKNLVCQAIKVVGEVSKTGGTTAVAALSFLREVWTLDSTLFVSAEQLEQLLPHLEKYTMPWSNRGGGENSSKTAGVAALKLADMYAVFASPRPAALLFAYGFQQPPIDAAIPHLAFEHYKKYIQACDGSCVTAVLPSHMLSTNNSDGVVGVQDGIGLEVKKQIEQFVKRCPDGSFSNGGSNENKDMHLGVVDNGRANRWVYVLREKSKYATIDQAAAAAAATTRREEEEKKEGIKGGEEIRVGWSNVMKAVVDFENIVDGSEDGKVTSGVAIEIRALSCRLGRLV